MLRVRRWGRVFFRVLVVSMFAACLVCLVPPSAMGESADAGAAADAQGQEAAEGQPASPARVAVIEIEGGIFLGSAEYVTDSIQRAQRESFGLLVIEMDTPGGALDETQEIVKALLSSRIPVVVYVTPKGAQAASAGTFITMAGHVAAMAPSTRIGAAHPVQIGMMPSMPSGDDKDDEKKKQQQQQQAIMNEKVTNDTVSFIRSIAEERGRNADWAEGAVRQSVSITAAEAVEKKVVDLEAETLSDLLEQIDGREVKIDKNTVVTLRTRGAEIVRWEKSLKQRLLGALAHPNLLWLLFMIGLGGIAMEFYHPGAIVPGALGALCLLLALISIQVLPVSLGGVLLVLAGIGLFVAEVFVTSYGLLGIGGGILLVLGGIMLVDPSSQPHYMDPGLQVDWSVLIPTAVVLGLGIILIGYKVITTQRRKIETGEEGMAGLVGEARSEVGPEDGNVFVRGEHWKARSESVIPKGAKIEVIRTEGLMLHVRQKD